MERVTVDTTAQTKAVAHCTDSHLLLRAIEWLTKLAEKHGVALRQSYLRLATRARREVGRLIHGRGHEQAMRYLRKMRTWTGRLARDIERKIEGQPGSAPCLRTQARTAQGIPGAEARRQEQALRPACARGEMHRQRQGAHAL
jgi:hypothetical protein